MSLSEKIEGVTKRNDELNQEARSLVEQRAAIDRKIAAIREEQNRLQGEYRAYEALQLEGTQGETLH